MTMKIMYFDITQQLIVYNISQQQRSQKIYAKMTTLGLDIL